MNFFDVIIYGSMATGIALSFYNGFKLYKKNKVQSIETSIDNQKELSEREKQILEARRIRNEKIFSKNQPVEKTIIQAFEQPVIQSSSENQQKELSEREKQILEARRIRNEKIFAKNQPVEQSVIQSSSENKQKEMSEREKQILEARRIRNEKIFAKPVISKSLDVDDETDEDDEIIKPKQRKISRIASFKKKLNNSSSRIDKLISNCKRHEDEKSSISAIVKNNLNHKKIDAISTIITAQQCYNYNDPDSPFYKPNYNEPEDYNDNNFQNDYEEPDDYIEPETDYEPDSETTESEPVHEPENIEQEKIQQQYTSASEPKQEEKQSDMIKDGNHFDYLYIQDSYLYRVNGPFVYRFFNNYFQNSNCYNKMYTTQYDAGMMKLKRYNSNNFIAYILQECLYTYDENGHGVRIGQFQNYNNYYALYAYSNCSYGSGYQILFPKQYRDNYDVIFASLLYNGFITDNF